MFLAAAAQFSLTQLKKFTAVGFIMVDMFYPVYLLDQYCMLAIFAQPWFLDKKISRY